MHTCVDHGPYPFLVVALTANMYCVSSSRSVKTVFCSLVDRCRFSSGVEDFQITMS